MPRSSNTSDPLGIRSSDVNLRLRWQQRLENLPPPAREALRQCLLDLRKEARIRAEYQWRRHKAPMAAYYKAISVYAGHIARTLAQTPPAPPR